MKVKLYPWQREFLKTLEAMQKHGYKAVMRPCRLGKPQLHKIIKELEDKLDEQN